MPSGKAHDKIWMKARSLGLASSIILFLFAELAVTIFYRDASFMFIEWKFATSTILTFGNMLGFAASRYITPDMDLVSITTTEYKMMRDWGIVGVLFVMYWMPYGHFMKHREKLSHVYVISSFGRALYGAWWVLAPLNLSFSTLWLGIALGMSTGDALHIYFDNNFREINGKLKRKR